MINRSILSFCPPSPHTKMLRHHLPNRKLQSPLLTMRGSFVILLSRTANCMTLRTGWMTAWLLIRADEVIFFKALKFKSIHQSLGSPPPHRHGSFHTYSYSYRHHTSPGTPAQSHSVPGYPTAS